MTGSTREPAVQRLAAFTDDPRGGNPARVVVTESPLADEQMQRIAAHVGYSETAFLTAPSEDRRRRRVRYLAPAAEVPFCGHATIAAGVLLGAHEGTGHVRLDTRAGEVTVALAEDEQGRRVGPFAPRPALPAGDRPRRSPPPAARPR